MEAVVSDISLNPISIVDTFESLIWAERYSVYGDFELHLPSTSRNLEVLQENRYLTINESDTVMILEGIQIDSDVENGAHLTVVGRSLESLLERRIVWKQTVLNGSVEDCVKQLLEENLINPSDTSRKIPNFVFRMSNDRDIELLTMRAQFTGDNLYDAVKAICDAFNLGFKITLEKGQFIFSLYIGKDRSFAQNRRPYVIFSPAFDNISSSNYTESSRSVKTVTLVAGEGEGADRVTATVAGDAGVGSGLTRRELFTDARDISSKLEDGTTLSATAYQQQLIQRGKEKLAECAVSKSFEGKVEDAMNFAYGRDYFMGDIVQVVNEYGLESAVRVTEFIRAHDLTGEQAYPTFTTT